MERRALTESDPDGYTGRESQSSESSAFVTFMSHDCWKAKGHIFLSFRRVTAAKYSPYQ